MILCHTCREKLKEQNLVLEKGSANDNADSRHQIDLNRSLTEEETQIDLEAPVIVETYHSWRNLYGKQMKTLHMNLIKNVPLFAKAIIASVKGTSSTACDEGSSLDVMDHFEYMALNLVETKLEQCCNVPSDNPKQDVAWSKRPQKGQTRRGRQQKDFSRDVLPSLACLLRNEVTEDLKTFEGSIRASGGSLQSGLAQRNAGKIDQQPQCGELQGVKDRSLTVTSWECNISARVEAYVSLGSEKRIVGNFGTFESAVLGVANADKLMELRRSRPKKPKAAVMGLIKVSHFLDLLIA
ncbi:hypothetical protein M0R45_033335 [Rubus argutus]|uniref:Uncharacterized protein n=1 Tax=Rubus argutus TaxID=59490 RepID=A0AAW1WM28_RUBAR